jgi:hypothetical protein
VADTGVKRLLCCGFRRTGTSVSMLVEDMSRNKCFFIAGSDIMFYVLCPFVTYLLTLRHWIVTPFSPVNVNQCFGGIYCLCLQD